jgi:hypothetical protein
VLHLKIDVYLFSESLPDKNILYIAYLVPAVAGRARDGR